MIKNQIVCIDDLERRGDGISLANVFGLISYLKESRNCKIALLLNDEELGKHKQEFEKHHEKVIDAFLKFSPTPNESVQIALPSDSAISKALAKNCKVLEISNIRVIKKIERLIQNIAPLLSEFDKEVMKQAIHSLTLFGWSKFQPNLAPSFDDIQKIRREAIFGPNEAHDQIEDDEVRKKKQKWKSLLESYEFHSIDEFDKALMKGVKEGFFDSNSIKQRATALDRSIKTRAGIGSFEQARNEFYNSFKGNENDILKNIYDSAKLNLPHITRETLNSTVKLLKEFEMTEQAIDLIYEYTETRNEDRQFWELEEFFPGERIEAEVKYVFDDKLASFDTEFDPVEVLLRIADQQACRDDEMEKLAQIGVGGFREIFEKAEGKQLRTLLRISLQYSDCDEGMSELEVSKAAKEALKQIGRESRLNAVRIKHICGIDISEEVEAVSGEEASPGTPQEPAV